ncbi:response regulator transcription factor [Vibrio rhodolitus]|uniref:response regulator transcription factor n=1 Tax=Vibrio rhodolitus TaxID=2231649 RepID=UPI000E0BDE5C|nr:response regulator transcription factor [Vibrio rhodolitus]
MLESKLSILLVEDNQDLVNTLIELFGMENIICDFASDGMSALKLVENNHYDLLVLDVNLPKISGLEISKKLRSSGFNLPIIMLTACNTLKDKLTGFEVGADDYLTKPFEFEELLARVKVLSKRKSGQVSIFKLDDLFINYDEKVVTRSGKKIDLTPICYVILEIISRASPFVVDKKVIINKIWGDDQPETNSLKVHMFNLRKAIDAEYSTKLIHTVKSQGFCLKALDE